MINEINYTTPLIQPLAYYDEQVFQKEKKRIFENQWNFAGFSFDLKQNNDFVCLDVGAKPVVIQNFNGQIKAFLNVCSHRFSQIQIEEKGNRAFTCPYHGWIYNENGAPIGIPQKNKFGNLDDAALKELCLEEYELAVCGTIVFVKKQCSQTESLETYLGCETFETLREMSDAFGNLIDHNEMVIDANWKIITENTLEAYHVNSIHPSTFKPIFGEQKFEDTHNVHTSITATLKVGWEKIESIYKSRPYPLDGYFHQLIFPNVTLASSYGASFSFQLFEPLNPTQTKFTSYVFQTKLIEESSPKEKVMINLMNQSIVDFNRVVFNEDKDICEKVQKGTRATNKKGLLSSDEKRVLSFQQAYQQFMESEQS